jgi:hypothetical protein
MASGQFFANHGDATMTMRVGIAGISALALAFVAWFGVKT